MEQHPALMASPSSYAGSDESYPPLPAALPSPPALVSMQLPSAPASAAGGASANVTVTSLGGSSMPPFPIEYPRAAAPCGPVGPHPSHLDYTATLDDSIPPLWSRQPSSAPRPPPPPPPPGHPYAVPPCLIEDAVFAAKPASDAASATAGGVIRADDVSLAAAGAVLRDPAPPPSVEEVAPPGRTEPAVPHNYNSICSTCGVVPQAASQERHARAGVEPIDVFLQELLEAMPTPPARAEAPMNPSSVSTCTTCGDRGGHGAVTSTRVRDGLLTPRVAHAASHADPWLEQFSRYASTASSHTASHKGSPSVAGGDAFTSLARQLVHDLRTRTPEPPPMELLSARLSQRCP